MKPTILLLLISLFAYFHYVWLILGVDPAGSSAVCQDVSRFPVCIPARTVSPCLAGQIRPSYHGTPGADSEQLPETGTTWAAARTVTMADISAGGVGSFATLLRLVLDHFPSAEQGQSGGRVWGPSGAVRPYSTYDAAAWRGPGGLLLGDPRSAFGLGVAADSGWQQAVHDRHGGGETVSYHGFSGGGSGGSEAGGRGPSGEARPDRTGDATAGCWPGKPRLGGPQSGFVPVERGWRQPRAGEARPDLTMRSESGEVGEDARAAGRRACG